MTTKKTILSVVIFFTTLTGIAWAGTAVPVSPGGGTELTDQICPTFSWSASEGALMYRIEIYEQMTTDILDRNMINGMYRPVVAREIPAPALSWTPSSGECLARGMRYVWYVEGVDANGGEWSEGRGFRVEAATLSIEQKDAVAEAVKGYLSEGNSGETGEQARTAGAITPQYAEGVSNNFFGAGAGASITDGYGDTFIGAYSGTATTSGWYNSFLGNRSGYSNTAGHENSFVGYAAGFFNNTGSRNSLLGAWAGRSNTTGWYNSFLGYNAGYSNTTGGSNSFFGAEAGHSNSTAYGNSFFGVDAGYSTTAGEYNSFIGNGAGYWNATGSHNVSIGAWAGSGNTTGNGNVFIGRASGYLNASGSRNVFLGYYAGYGETGSNKLYIDNCFTAGSCSKPFIKGDFAARTLQIDGSLTIVTVATPSDIRYKKEIHPLESSLEKVLKLRGVTYEWDEDKVRGAGFGDGRQIGFIAQDVESVLPELVHTDGEGYKTLSYDKFGPVLVEALKEQQREIKEQTATITEQKAEIAALKEKLEKAIETIERRLASLGK